MNTQEWILPNRVYFNKWVYNNFHPSKYKTTKKQGFSPEPYQLLIKDFLKKNTPYRGLLVYHGLGTGKTCTSILASEDFINHGSKVVVMTPASLENNYRKELNKCSNTGSLLRKKWTQIKLDFKKHMEVYDTLKTVFGFTKTFINKLDDTLWLPFIPEGVPSDVVISKPSTYKSLSDTDKTKINTIYEFLINDRYTFLHYNGLTGKKLDELEKKDDYGKDTFDDTIVIIDEVHTFISRVVNGGKIARRIYNTLLYKPNIKIVMLSGTPIINTPFELCYTLNLLRGPIDEYSLNLLKNSRITSDEELKDTLKKENLLQFIDDVYISQIDNKIHLTILPKGFVRSDNSIEIKQGTSIRNNNDFIKDLINKLKKHYGIGVRFSHNQTTALPLNEKDFYSLFFSNGEPNSNMDLFMKRISGIVSYFGTSDTESYPELLPIIHKKIPMSGTQFNYYVEVRNKEIAKDEKNKQKMRKQSSGDNMFSNKNSSYRAFSRMSCNYVFPEKIKRPFPSDIYGKLLRKEIDISETEETETETVKVKGNVDITKEYEKDLSKALKSLEKDSSIYLQNDGLSESSPKMKELLDMLTTNPSKSLLYSQFRTVEGLGIFRMVLKNAGWVEIDFKSKENNDWEIVNDDEVLSKKYDGKRYMTFGDKNKTDIIINLFNADTNYLPPTIQKQLEKAKLTENLRGKLCSLLMITQSGAEGLSLRNVRNVYILEPYWNQVRINQVIGRAVRKNSHLELPKEERNVQATILMSTFTKEQAKANKTILFKDNALTTDENILELASKKDTIIQKFLTLLKSNAFDCTFNSNTNKPLLNDYTCFSFPINSEKEELVYNPDIKNDMALSTFKKVVNKRKIKGSVVVKNDVKYVKLPNDNVLYDYQAYKYASTLIPSEHE